MAVKKKIEQPNEIWKAKMSELMSAEPEEFEFSGKKIKLGWIHYGTYRKFASIMNHEEDGWKRNIKLASLILMNVKSGFLSKIRTRLLYPIHWRWLYYIKDIDMMEVLMVIDAAKKKLQSEPYLMCTILSIGLMDEMVGMTMKAKEVKAGQAGQNGVNSSR